VNDSEVFEEIPRVSYAPDSGMLAEVDHPEAAIYQFPVVRKNSSATEDTGATPLSGEIGPGVPEAKEPARSFLQVGRKNLSEKDLSTPAARRFLIAEIERLDQQCVEHQGFVQKFHDQRVTIATLTESAKISTWKEILSGACLAVGAAGLGAAPGYFSIPGAVSYGIVFFGISLFLVGIGVASRVWR